MESENKKMNWGLTLIFCLIFGALGYIMGTTSNCGKARSCEGHRSSCVAPHGGHGGHHGDMKAHEGERGNKACCADGKKCKKHSKHEKNVEIEIKEEIED